MHVIVLEYLNEPVSIGTRPEAKVEQVCRMMCPVGDRWKSYVVRACPLAQFACVPRPDRRPSGLDLLPPFELPEEHPGEQVAEHPRRSDIDPRVFVDLPPEEAGSVSALLAKYLRAFCEALIVEVECAAFTARDVFCLMKTHRGHASEGSERAVMELSEQSVRVVFDKGDPALRAQFSETVRLGCNSGVVHDADRLGPRRQRVNHSVKVEVKRVLSNISEDGPAAMHQERAGSGHERVGRDDDLVAGFKAKEPGAHLERMCARRREQGSPASVRCLEESLCPLGHRTVAREVFAF